MTKRRRRKSRSHRPRLQLNVRSPQIEPLEPRLVLASDWQNVDFPTNVDNVDQVVSPLDAIAVINELDARRFSHEETGRLDDLGEGESPPTYVDVDGDGYVSPIDALLVINRLHAVSVGTAPSISAEFDDTGVLGDGITNTGLINGTFINAEDGFGVYAQIGGGDEVEIAVDENGGFYVQPVGLNDGDHAVTITLRNGNNAAVERSTVSFSLDTTAPNLVPFELESSFRRHPDNPALTDNAMVAIAGQAEPNQEFTLFTLGSQTTHTTDANGDFSISGLAVDDGLTPFTTIVEDVAGNRAEYSLSISRVTDMPSDDPFELSFVEGNQWLHERAILIELGQAEGNRRLSFDIDATFDTADVDTLIGDLFQVYLVDPKNPGTTLLDRGSEGQALFSMNEMGTDFLAGLVSFDSTLGDTAASQRQGTIVIDLTSLADLDEGLLVFQLINGDSDDQTSVSISAGESINDEDGVAAPTLRPDRVLKELGERIDLTGYRAVNDSVEVLVENVRVDGESGHYLADLSVMNDGELLSRNMAIRLTGLPNSVEALNASGKDEAGVPYFNLQPAIPNGGLDFSAITTRFEVEIANPDGVRFELTADVVSTGFNQAPVFPALEPITVMPGDALTLELNATDPDGDRVVYAITNAQQLPSNIVGQDSITIMPSPEDVGTYEMVLRAGDGRSHTDVRVPLEVIADPVTTTRISGWVLDSDGTTPLPGVPVEVTDENDKVLGKSMTNVDGQFTVEAPGLTGDGALKVRANEANIDGKTYPFVAEKVHLVMPANSIETREIFEGVNNVVTRPIYLPALDVAGGTPIDPEFSKDFQVVEQEIAPGEIAKVYVQTGSLMTDNGNGQMVPFDGVLSITEVPRELTPAALPRNFLPNLVVTIQPGEMRFDTPAALTLPNRTRLPDGVKMGLWSINPVTGEFDEVGRGVADGDVVRTVEGGIQNSSWHFFSIDNPTAVPPKSLDQNQSMQSHCGCTGEVAIESINSYLELHSGAVRESHTLPSYASLGASRGLTLNYHSLRADASPIVYFGIDDADLRSFGNRIGDFDWTYVARGAFQRGDFFREVPGHSGDANLPGALYWDLPFGTAGPNDIPTTSAFLGDLRDQPSGVYYAVTESGILMEPIRLFDGSLLSAFANGDLYSGTEASAAPFVSVNSIDSPFGAGWEIGGLQYIVDDNPDGELLLVDGSGHHVVFQMGDADIYESPVGDFTIMERTATGFRRTFNDQTVYEFNSDGLLESIRDRNGNETTYFYDGGKIQRIVDPLSLATVFGYGGDGRVATITDPASRVTRLGYDGSGNLQSIEAPDGSIRSFRYDAKNHLIEEENQNGEIERTFYGFHGRAEKTIRRDGTQLEFQLPQPQVFDEFGPPSDDPEMATTIGLVPVEMVYRSSDGRGTVSVGTLDGLGQRKESSDAIGQISIVGRDFDNLVSSLVDARSNNTSLDHDARGNVIEIRDNINTNRAGTSSAGVGQDNSVFPQTLSTNASSVSIGHEFHDFNGDGFLDMLALDEVGTILLGSSSGFSQGSNRWSPFTFTNYSIADYNGDQFLDLIVRREDALWAIPGSVSGDFDAPAQLPIGGLVLPASNTDRTPWKLEDINGDGVLDLIVSSETSSIGIHLGLANDESWEIEGYSDRIGFETEHIVKDFALSDANRDGLFDVIAANDDADAGFTFAVFEAVVTPTNPLGFEYSEPRRYGSVPVDSGVTVARSPDSIAVHDFDGDEYPDVVVATAEGVATYISDGLGGWADLSTLPQTTIASPACVLAADVNGDDALDLLVTALVRRGSTFSEPENLSDQVGVYLSDGEGGFEFSDLIALAREDARRICRTGVSDVDANGTVDIVMSDDHDAYTFFGTGDGKFVSVDDLTNKELGFAVHAAVSVDLNNDGLADVAGAGDGIGFAIAAANGDAPTVSTYNLTPAGGDRLGSTIFTTGDFDGDGRDDIALAVEDGVVVYWTQQGKPYEWPRAFFPSGESAVQLVTFDVNGDGIKDVMAVGAEETRVLAGTRSRQLVDQPIELVGSVESVVITDLNSDAIDDVVVFSDDETRLFALGQLEGGFGQFSDFGFTFVEFAVIQANNDTFPDIVTIDETGAMQIYRGESGVGFDESQPISVGLDGVGTPHGIAVGLIDNDQHADIVVATSDSTRCDGDFAGACLTVLKGDGGGRFLVNTQTPFTSEQAFFTDRIHVEVADIDQDGDADVIASRGRTTVFYNNGRADFVTEEMDRADGGIFALANLTFDPVVVNGEQVGFVDNRLPEIVTLEVMFLHRSLTFHYNKSRAANPTQRFDRLPIIPQLWDLFVSNSYRSIDYGDLNDDGNVDLVAGSNDSSQVSVLFGDGNGGGTLQLINEGRIRSGTFFTGGVGFVGGSQVAVEDIDGDSIDDIVAVDISETNVFFGSRTGEFAEIETVFGGDTILVVADFTGDGELDIYAGGDSVLSFSAGRREFGEMSTRFDGASGELAAAGDINGDGYTDLILGGDRNVIQLFLSTGPGTYRRGSVSILGIPTSIGLFDVDADGLVDILVGNSDRDINVLFGQIGGTFLGALTVPSNEVSGFAFGDSDGDGVKEAFAATRTGIFSFQSAIGSRGFLSRQFTYDAIFNQLETATDELGRTTTYTIDPANGNTKSILDNGLLRTQFTYTSRGLVEMVTDPEGTVTKYDYNPRGLVDSITFALGTSDAATQQFGYDNAGNQNLFIDEEGNRTIYEYDSMNRLKKVIEADPDGAGPLRSPITEYDYDNRGNLIWQKDSRGSVTTLKYDSMDRLLWTRDEDFNQTTNTYSVDGNLASVTDPNGSTVTYDYDERDRQISMTEPGPHGGTTKYSYDANGNLTSLIDPVGNRTAFVYDSRDRLVQETDPFGEKSTYTYDAVNNLVEMKDRNGRVTTYEYDDVDRLKVETWQASSTGTNEIRYDYDDASNLKSISDRFSELTYTYDDRYRVETVSNEGTLPGSELPTVVMTYNYDDVGNVLEVSETIGGSPAATTSYEYDALNRTVEIEQAGGGVSEKAIDFIYNSLGQFDQIDRYSSLARGQDNLVASTEYKYDNLNRLKSLEHGRTVGTRDIAFYDFEYDSASRIKALTDIDGRTAYGYDPTNQLTSANRADEDQRGDERYDYDRNGNRTDSHLHGSKYDTGKGNRLASDGTYTYQYDNEGNTVRRTDIATGAYRTFAYDHRNRLVLVEDHSTDGAVVQEVVFVYDAIDRRIAKTVDIDGAGAIDANTVHFVYQGAQAVLEFVDADGDNTASSPGLDTRYVFGPQIDMVLAQEASTDAGTTWLLADHLGTVRDLIDDNGSVLNHITYDSFGNVVSQINPANSTRYLFTGREFDDELNLYYFRARFYDSINGRFMSEDPIGFAARNTNSYGYTENSPIVKKDVNGLISREVIVTSVGNEFVMRGWLPNGRDAVGSYAYTLRNARGVKVIHGERLQGSSSLLAGVDKITYVGHLFLFHPDLRISQHPGYRNRMVEHPFAPRRMSAREFGKILLDNGFRGGAIELVVCSSGNYPFPRQLSNFLRGRGAPTSVRAPTVDVRVDQKHGTAAVVADGSMCQAQPRPACTEAPHREFGP